MKQLLISDLHLTAQARDEYRWQIFPWLAKTINTSGVRHLFILGDLTEAKDYHSARLVNLIADSFQLLMRAQAIEPLHIWIIRGNHDGIDPDCAFFRFLGHYPNIHYISTPYMLTIDGEVVQMLPHAAEPARAWEEVDLHLATVVLMHATMAGARAETGATLQGLTPLLLARCAKAKIWSGDVHVPQKVGRVEYVGAPYPVRFGDSFVGRAILLEDWKKPADLRPPGIRRQIVTVGPKGAGPQDMQGLGKGDQIKLRIRLTPAEYGDWQDAKRASLQLATAMGVEVCGLELEKVEAAAPTPIIRKRLVVRSPEQVFDEFCAAGKVDRTLHAAGKAILKGVL